VADITGTSKNDKRTGTADRDTFYGMAGNDDFDGKGGTDTARYVGRFSEFDIKTKGNEVEVKDKEKKGASGDEGNDKLKDVERLEFADKLVVLKDAAPVGADITKSTNEDEAAKIYVSEFASDVDGDGLVLSNLKATNGTVTQGSDGRGAYITYTPNPDYNGPAQITYTVTEKFAKPAVDIKGKAYGAKSDTGTITIDVKPVDDVPPPPVNAPPIAVDDTATTPEDTATVIDVLANDTDANADDTLSIVPGSVSVTAGQGTAEIFEGKIRFTPGQDYNGTAEIVYKVSDGKAEDEGKVTVEVTPVADTPPNRAPVAVNDATTTPEDTAVTFDVVGNDPDPDGDALTVTAATLAGVSPDAEAPGTVVIVNNQVRYTPAANSTTDVIINYTVADPDGATASAQLAVEVTPVNDAPTGGVAIAITTGTAPLNEGDVLTATNNIADADGIADGAITYQWQVQEGEAWVIAGEGDTYTVRAEDEGNAIRAVASYTDNAGNDHTVTSDEVLVPEPENRPPVAVDDVDEIPEDSAAVSINVLANDSDPDGDSLTVTAATLAGGDAGEGTVEFTDTQVTFTPAANFAGRTVINYTIADPDGATATAQLTVTVMPENDGSTGSVSITGSQDGVIVGETLAADISQLVDPDGAPTNLTYVWETIGLTEDDRVVEQSGPNADYVVEADDVGRTVRLTVNYTDGQGFAESTQSSPTTPVLPPVPVNTPPVAVSDTATTDEDVSVTIPVLANDLNPDGDALTVTATLAGGGSVTGTVNVTADNQVVFTPAENDFGEATINYTISDGTFDSSSTVAVTVTSVNDAPRLVSPLPDRSVESPFTGGPLRENDPFQFSFNNNTSGNAFFTDVEDGQNLSFSATLENGNPLPSWLTFSPRGGQSGDAPTFSGTPPDTAAGTYFVELTATDSGGLSASDVFEIDVLEAFVPPVINTDDFQRGVIGTVTDDGQIVRNDTTGQPVRAINAREPNSGNPEIRHGILEFQIGADVDNLTSATLRLDPNGPVNTASFPNSMTVFAYAGDGLLTGDDGTRPAVQVGSVTFEAADVARPAYVPVDLNEEVLNSLLPSGTGWLGFRLEMVEETNNNLNNAVSIEAGGAATPSPSMLDLTWIS
jgi:hypothetical protein